MTDDAQRIQRLYPQIYLACHREHVRAASTEWELSARDSSVLAHLDESTPVRPRDLARHLNISPSTLSALLTRLEGLGYINNLAAGNDKRRRELTLTARGVEAMASTSVLDRVRVQRLLSKLSAAERAEAIGGLEILARAARALQEES